MIDPKVSNDASRFEVRAVLDTSGKLTDDCARQSHEVMEQHGLVILTELLSDDEADAGLELMRQTIDDPDRNRCSFASETDNRYLRRDFCSLPSTPAVKSFAATLCQRLEGVLSEYCGRSNPVLEVTTMTSYLGSSHQYVHRDPSGVISLFAAVEDVSEAQGGTVFVPGTQLYGSAQEEDAGKERDWMELFRTRTNIRILRHNLSKVWRMRTSEEAPLAPGEFLERVFSKTWDEHQPNLLRFAMGKNSQFNLRMLGPKVVWNLHRDRDSLNARFQLVKTAPKKGTVILYQSDLLHAGPDNRSVDPRRLFSMSIARDMIETKSWHTGYSPHPTLKADPITLGDLLDFSAANETSELPAPSVDTLVD